MKYAILLNLSLCLLIPAQATELLNYVDWNQLTKDQQKEEKILLRAVEWYADLTIRFHDKGIITVKKSQSESEAAKIKIDDLPQWLQENQSTIAFAWFYHSHQADLNAHDAAQVINICMENGVTHLSIAEAAGGAFDSIRLVARATRDQTFHNQIKHQQSQKKDNDNRKNMQLKAIGWDPPLPDLDLDQLGLLPVYLHLNYFQTTGELEPDVVTHLQRHRNALPTQLDIKEKPSSPQTLSRICYRSAEHAMALALTDQTQHVVYPLLLQHALYSASLSEIDRDRWLQDNDFMRIINMIRHIEATLGSPEVSDADKAELRKTVHIAQENFQKRLHPAELAAVRQAFDQLPAGE